MAFVKIKDKSGNIFKINADLSQGLKITDIEPREKWQLKLVDKNEESNSIEFAGGRPDDR